MLGDVGDDPEPFLDALFEAWYELLAIGTIAVPGAATYDRMAKLIRSQPESEKPLVADIAERFPQVASLADGQPDFLHGVIEFFRTRTRCPHDDRRGRAHRDVRATARSHPQSTSRGSPSSPSPPPSADISANVAYPGFGPTSGLIDPALIMLILAAALYIIFKRKKWL